MKVIMNIEDSEENEKEELLHFKDLNFRHQILDEISLEGLDGITLEALWLRLENRPHFTLFSDAKTDRMTKEFVWKVVLSLSNDVAMYRLNKPRNKLVIFNRYDYMDNDLGIVIEPKDVPEDIYPYCLIDNEETDEKGSCASYHTRTPIDDGAIRTLEAAEKFGNTLVLVASQEARSLALLGPEHDPLQAASITAKQWVILERIGRSRYLGEVTQGKLSLKFTNEDPKSLFYYRKPLLESGFITKQIHHQKTYVHGDIGSQKSRSQNSQGSLFHLPRFRVERQPKALILVQKVINYLRSKPRAMVTYDDLRDFLGPETSMKKLLKTQEFQRFIKGDVRVPYRHVYPEAPEADWKRKGCNEEKQLRVVQLKDDHIDPRDVFRDFEDGGGGEQEARDGSPPPYVKSDYVVAVGSHSVNDTYDEYMDTSTRDSSIVDASLNFSARDEDSELKVFGYNRAPACFTKYCKPPEGVLDQSGLAVNRTIMWQAFKTLLEAGPEGLSQQQLSQTMGFGKKEAFRICKNMKDRNMAFTIMKDIGRQRVTNFVATKFQHLSSATSQLLLEKRKNEELMGGISNGSVTRSGYATPTDFGGNPVQSNAIPIKMDCDDQDGTYEGESQSKQLANHPRVLLSPLKQQWLDGRKSVSTSGRTTPTNMSTFDIGSPIKIMGSPSKMASKDKSTFRQLRRTNIIIEAVRHHKFITDPTKLYKIIQEEENREGNVAKMDKKTLMRIIDTLEKKGQIKSYKPRLESNSKTLHFICDPSVEDNDPALQSVIEQAKMKFSITPKEQDLEGPRPMGGSAPGSPKKMIKSANRCKYGLQPKFIRMRELHTLMFYLVYDYTGDLHLDQDQVIEQLSVRGYLDIPVSNKIDQSEELMPENVLNLISSNRIYHSDVSWKMFLDPLPEHKDWTTGWAMIGDVLLRIPLVIFVKLVHITFEIPGLSAYLNHPILKNILVRSLPQPIKDRLLYKRKYIFSIHEIAQRLAFIGLAQFGPQGPKGKDEIYVYLNRRAALFDTSASSPGYYQVEKKEYPKYDYNLESLDSLEQYWLKMWEICFNTSLGGTGSHSTQDMIQEALDKKPEMVMTLFSKSSEEAAAYDNGEIPGDGLGAAGLDSGLFAHLKRNWTFSNSIKSRKKLLDAGKENAPASSSAGPKKPAIKTSHRAVTGHQRKGGPGIKRRMSNSAKSSNQPPSKVPKLNKSKPVSRRENNDSNANGDGDESLSNREQPAKRAPLAKERKPYYDEKDKEALRHMRKLRVDWNDTEDSFLLICKVAGLYLCSNNRNQMVQYTVVRDLLHSYYPKSVNKTSRACQRRLNYMLKNQMSMYNVLLHLEEIKQDEEILQLFPQDGLENFSKAEQEAKRDKYFVDLVNLLMEKLKRVNQVQKTRPLLPSTRAELEEKYEICAPTIHSPVKLGFSEPDDVNDVLMGVLNALITSALCCVNDKKNWTFQLYKIYQQYPDTLLRNVMTHLRENKIVSLKKQYNKTKVRQKNFLPLSSSPYQLSVTFSHTFLNRYQHDIYSQSWDLVKTLLDNNYKQNNEGYCEIRVGQEGGFAAAVIGLLARNKLLFRTMVPEQLVILDPSLSSSDENYVRILQRYKELMKNSGSIDNADVDYPDPQAKSKTSQSAAKSSDANAAADGTVRPVGKSSSDAKKSFKPERKDETGAREKGGSDGGHNFRNEIIFQEGGDTRGNHAVAKSASRIALYMMREEMGENPMEARDPIQHSHDFFVISSCSIHGKILTNRHRSREQSSESVSAAQVTVKKTIKYGNLIVDKDDLPGNADACSNLLKGFGLDIHGMPRNNLAGVARSHMVPLSPPSMQTVIEEMAEKDPPTDWSTLHKEQLERLISLVESEKELGMTCKQLRTLISSLGGHEMVARCLEVGIQHHLIVEVGVVELRYVAYKYCRNWLLQTYRLTRNDTDSMSMPKHAGKLYQGNTGPQTESSTDPELPGPTSGEKVTRSRSSSLDKAVGGEDIRIAGRNARRNPQVSHRVSEAVSSVNWDNMEMVLVAVRPWVRVDGSLNRRVYDRLLGAVLGAVMERPGAPLDKFTSRFLPALQPHHTRDLIIALSELEAITVSRLHKPAVCSLWTRPSDTAVTQEVAGGHREAVAFLRLYPDTELIVEPTVDAILRLGMFIGDKQYSQDFVCQCPCHPDRRM